ncbi:MAG: hypothetical protein MZV64_04645 [Ignavibacteriales bacterium]|nr:hypothetical protein [Ignavibacteriales bacterium]
MSWRPGHERHLQLRADAVGARRPAPGRGSPCRGGTGRRTSRSSDSTPGVNVRFASPLMRLTVSLPALMSTPECLVVHGRALCQKQESRSKNGSANAFVRPRAPVAGPPLSRCGRP